MFLPLICESQPGGFRLALPCVTLPAHVVALCPHIVQHRLEIADTLFEQGSAYGFRESRVTPRCAPGYGLFRRTVGICYVREGWVNPVQLASMHHCPNSSFVPLIRPALMLLNIEVFDIPTARAACPNV